MVGVHQHFEILSHVGQFKVRFLSVDDSPYFTEMKEELIMLQKVRD